jgi:hypothetical protein
MQGGVDTVAQDVGLVVGERAVQRAHDHPQQQVDLPGTGAQASACCLGQPFVGRAGQDAQILQHVGVGAEG